MDNPQTPSPEPEQVSTHKRPQGSLGATVGKGITAMMLSTVANRGIALAAQGVLGYLLTRADFGVFAIATSAAAMVQALRDGGLRTVLIQRGAAQYDELCGPIFWMSLTCNALAAALLAACGPIFGGVYGDHRIAWLLLIMAVILPAGTPLLIFESKLRIDLRFDVLSKVTVYSSFGRYGVTIGSAMLGAGALSMAYGMVAATVVETAACYMASPDQPWGRAPEFAKWRGLLAEGKWTILQVLGASLLYYGAYVPMGLLVPSDVVGLYFFAFSIVSISGHLLVTNVESVMLPSIARLAGHPERRRQAMLRSVRGITLACTPLSLMVGVTYAPLQRLIWPSGQWDGSVIPVQIMAFTYPLFMLHVIPRTVLTGAGQFRDAAVLILVIGLGLMLAATLAAWLVGTATAIAAFAGIYSAAAGLLASCIVMNEQGVSHSNTIKVILPIWATLSIVALGIILLDLRFCKHLPLIVRIAVSTTLTGVGFLFLARVSFRDSVDDVLSVLPRRISRAARVVLSGRNG